MTDFGIWIAIYKGKRSQIEWCALKGKQKVKG